MEDGDGTPFRTRANQGGSTITGGELTANYRARARLSGSLGISYVDARYDEPQIIFDDDGATLATSRYLKASRFGAIGQLLFAPFERLQGFAALRYVDHMRVLNNRTGQIVRTPDFVVADVSLTQHFSTAGGRDIDISLGVKNLFDERQRDLEIGATRDSDYVYGPRQARTFFARLDAAF